MDFLNNAIAQVGDLFRSMTPGARVTAGLLLAVVVISVAYLFQQGVSGPDAFLFGGQALSDRELTEIEAAIAKIGLSGAVREGNRLRVPRGQQAAYLAAVADAGALPRNFNAILEKGLDKGSPWESREATRERLKILKQQLLSEIVRHMPWVEEAVVVIDQQPPRGLAGTGQVTGTVNVQPVRGETMDPRRIRVLQTLVARSIVGLKPEEVAVTNLGDGGGFGSDGNIYPEMFNDEYFSRKVAFELQKKSSIENALIHIPGVRVEVNAELDDTAEELTQNVKPDSKPVTLRETETLESSEQSTTDGAGRPGTFAQGPNRQGAADTPQRQTQSKTETEVTQRENAVGQEQITRRRTGFTPKEVWATVTIPSSHVENLWRRHQPDAPDPPRPEDLNPIKDKLVTDVENIVEPLLLVQGTKGENTYKYVSVVVVDTLPGPTIEPPTLSNRALAWTSHYWSTLAMLGVAMFSLLVLRSVVKGSPTGGGGASAAPAPPTLALESPDASRSDEEHDGEGEERPRLRLRKSHSLKDELVEIVRKDPDTAADILRTWISKAG